MANLKVRALEPVFSSYESVTLEAGLEAASLDFAGRISTIRRSRRLCR